MILRRQVSAVFAAEAFFFQVALIMAIWVHLPLLALAGIGLLALTFFAAQWTDANIIWPSLLSSACAVAGCIGTNIWEPYFAIVAGLIAAALCLGGQRWRGLGMAWVLASGMICLGASYQYNWGDFFYLAWVAMIAWALIVRATFKLPALAIIVLNTALLFGISLPLADWFIGPNRLLSGSWSSYYSYEASGHNPAAFARWEAYLLNEQIPRMAERIYEPASVGTATYRLRPGSHGEFFQCPISINSQGFRGAEIPPIKGNTYRIVALGESTTFGFTLTPDAKPWPDLLEEIIRQRLKLRRPVEVINAGVPGYSLDHNMARLSTQIFGVKPDMIISYHGYNGFPMLGSGYRERVGPALPLYCPRPVKLLADCEYRLKMHEYSKRYSWTPPPKQAEVNPMDTYYAELYRKLIRMADTNHIQLVLATYSMAVNTTSSPSVLAFYGGGYSDVEEEIHANVVHTELVKDLAAEHPEVGFVDTHPHLDGEHEKFIDLIHLTQPGRQQLAEAMFAGIRGILEQQANRPYN